MLFEVPCTGQPSKPPQAQWQPYDGYTLLLRRLSHPPHRCAAAYSFTLLLPAAANVCDAVVQLMLVTRGQRGKPKRTPKTPQTRPKWIELGPLGALSGPVRSERPRVRSETPRMNGLRNVDLHGIRFGLYGATWKFSGMRRSVGEGGGEGDTALRLVEKFAIRRQRGIYNPSIGQLSRSVA